MKTKKLLILLAHALAGWALCFAIMGIGMAVTTPDKALIMHAAAAPVIFGTVSMVYFIRFHYTTPIQTALAFTGFVIITDFFLVALVINRSLEMFASLLGTWIPFGLIFLSTYLAGSYVGKTRLQAAVQ
jgi:hypothetical protein